MSTKHKIVRGLTEAVRHQRVYESVARNLREFGYSDVSAIMIAEIHQAMRRGETPLPHGVIGMFAKSQLESDDVQAAFASVPW